MIKTGFLFNLTTKKKQVQETFRVPSNTPLCVQYYLKVFGFPSFTQVMQTPEEIRFYMNGTTNYSRGSHNVVERNCLKVENIQKLLRP